MYSQKTLDDILGAKLFELCCKYPVPACPRCGPKRQAVVYLEHVTKNRLRTSIGAVARYKGPQVTYECGIQFGMPERNKTLQHPCPKLRLIEEHVRRARHWIQFACRALVTDHAYCRIQEDGPSCSNRRAVLPLPCAPTYHRVSFAISQELSFAVAIACMQTHVHRSGPCTSC